MDEKKKPPTPRGLLRIKDLNFFSCIDNTPNMGDGISQSTSGVFVENTQSVFNTQQANDAYYDKQLFSNDLTESDDSFQSTNDASDEEDTQTIVNPQEAEDGLSDNLLFDNDSSESDDSLLSTSDVLVEEDSQVAVNQQQAEHASSDRYRDCPHVSTLNWSSDENPKLDTTMLNAKTQKTRDDSGCETDEFESHTEVCSGVSSISVLNPEESSAMCPLQTSIETCECSLDEEDGFVIDTIYEREVEETSEVSMRLNLENETAGFSLTTDKKGHRILGVQTLLFPDLGFRDGDRIIAIQSMYVGHWDHAIMREFLCDMFGPSAKPFTMIVKRINVFIEINIDLVDIDDGDNVLSKVSLIVRRSLKYKISKPFIKVKLVEYIGERLCTVSHTVSDEEKLFFRINEKEILILEHYSLEYEKSFRFRMTQYKGIQRCNRCPERVFFCQFVSCLTGRCLTIKGLTKVGLTDTVSKTWELKALTRADPRYFKCNRTSEDNTRHTIESLVHPDLYVAVSRDKNIYLSDQRIEGGETVFEINYLDTL